MKSKLFLVCILSMTMFFIPNNNVTAANNINYEEMSYVEPSRVWVEELRTYIQDYIYVEKNVAGTMMRGYLALQKGGFYGGQSAGIYAGYLYPFNKAIPVPFKMPIDLLLE